MYSTIIYTLVAISTSLLQPLSAHSAGDHSLESVPMSSRSPSSERHHIGDHLGDVVGDMDTMSDDQLRFLYFKMHDTDSNEKLDGKELVDSLLHFHVEEGQPKVFGSDELANMIDPILKSDDVNWDGFIDYQEFVRAQKARGF
ncbi:hypothetical protein JTE90_014888 [Oedothorax gibbosus]|uniref:EF-hand domain-containing protein n=1 Tax=Oedothorax gibbosus TaxID=931172 RepID=A0AAV6TZ25_9ARAC|nr:hypothetical protein JTE90_014888 [Oedothorax gibbosus]